MDPLKYQRNQYCNAIVCCQDHDKVWSFKKYHTIQYNDIKIEKFAKFVKREFPNAQYINFYDKDTRAYLDRLYLI